MTDPLAWCDRASADTTAPLTRAELDRLTCQTPGCAHDHHDGLVLNSRCHTRKPTFVRYWGDGVVEVRCRICNGFVASIALDGTSAAHMNEALFPCPDPNCDKPPNEHSLTLKSSPCHRRHAKAGIFVAYKNGELQFFCSVCKKQTAHLNVKGALS